MLSGIITSADAACRDDVEVTIEVDEQDDQPDDWRAVAHTRTTEGGEFSEIVLPQDTADYRATLGDARGGCPAGVSEEVTLEVRVAVGIDASRRRVEPGSAAKLTVRVRPLCRREAAPRMSARLYRFRNGRLVEVASRKISDGCVVTFERRIRGTAVFQARFPAIDGLHWAYLGGRSSLEVVGTK